MSLCLLLFFFFFFLSSHLLMYKVVAQEMSAYSPHNGTLRPITSPLRRKGFFLLVDIVFSKRTAGENEIRAGANGRLMTGLDKIECNLFFPSWFLLSLWRLSSVLRLKGWNTPVHWRRLCFFPSSSLLQSHWSDPIIRLDRTLSCPIPFGGICYCLPSWLAPIFITRRFFSLPPTLKVVKATEVRDGQWPSD